MQRLLCLCIFALGTLVGAVPTRRADTHTGVRLSLEPRDDGYVNGLALRKALSAHNAEYARTSKINPRHRIQPDPIINTAPAHSDPEVLRRSSDSLEERSTGQSISRAVAIERRKNYQPWVTLKLTGNTIDRFTDGEYLGEISIKDHTTPFRARFDTTTFNTLVPGRSCESENGCEGSPNSKYDESGISIVSRSSTKSDNDTARGCHNSCPGYSKQKPVIPFQLTAGIRISIAIWPKRLEECLLVAISFLGAYVLVTCRCQTQYGSGMSYGIFIFLYARYHLYTLTLATERPGRSSLS